MGVLVNGTNFYSKYRRVEWGASVPFSSSILSYHVLYYYQTMPLYICTRDLEFASSDVDTWYAEAGEIGVLAEEILKCMHLLGII
jgi:hypothetical protein